MTEPADRCAGMGIIRASWVGAGIFVVVAVAATIAPDALSAAFVIVSVVLFGIGIGVFLWAYAIAVARSRTDAIGIGGLFFLQGSAPRPVQVRLLIPFAVEVAVALAAALIHMYSPLAFGILVPMYGLGMAGLWGARYGTFAAREPDGGASTTA